MKRRATIAFVGSWLALGLWSMTAYSADDDDDKEIKEGQAAVLKLVEAMNGKKGNVKAQTQAIKEKFKEIGPIMWVYKDRGKGGLGWGKEGSDIEKKFRGFGSNKPEDRLTPKKAADMKDDLIKVADLSRAIAEISKLYDQKYKEENGKLNPAKWKEFTEKMSKGADELREAAKGGEVAKIKRAADNLNASCQGCHGVFRNNN